MTQMTARERLIAALNGEPVDYLPFSPFLAYVWESFPKAIRDEGPLAFHHHIVATPLWRGAPCPVRAILPQVETRTAEDGPRTLTEVHTPVGTLRSVYLRSDVGNTNFLIEHPLKTEDDFKTQLWIEEHTRFDVDLTPVQDHFSGNGREGLSIGMLLPRSKSAFQSLIEHNVGTEELIYALADYPDTVETLWQTMVDNDLKTAKMAAATGMYAYYLTWEDSGTQNYSPRMYSHYIASEIAQWCELLETNGMRYIQHACGHLKHLLEPMKTSGVFAVESISPPPTGNITLRDARALAGDGFGIIGGIEPTLFLNLSLAELVPYVEGVIADGKGGEGQRAHFVLANSDSCPPGVTVEKFKLVAEIARQYRE
jgi:hypothetical protein